jgi:hypothetical protein
LIKRFESFAKPTLWLQPCNSHLNSHIAYRSP